eukprot:6185411-Pleurochrysis_carterae.AAC.2
MEKTRAMREGARPEVAAASRGVASYKPAGVFCDRSQLLVAGRLLKPGRQPQKCCARLMTTSKSITEHIRQTALRLHYHIGIRR